MTSRPIENTPAVSGLLIGTVDKGGRAWPLYMAKEITAGPDKGRFRVIYHKNGAAFPGTVSAGAIRKGVTSGT